jgi:FkbM family methyltransferase
MTTPSIKPSGLKRLAWKSPLAIRHSLRRAHFMLQAARKRLVSNEPEHAMLDRLLKPGEWAIDVGANVGHYTLRMSEVVGAKGRVISFEPVTSTFEILSATCRFAPFPNVTLINAAASDTCGLVGLSVPQPGGMPNFYLAHVNSGPAEQSALALTVDSLNLSNRVSLVKIDAEGHDQAVLRGMKALLQRDRPILIVEFGPESAGWLSELGYRPQQLPGVRNVIFRAD